MHMKTDDSLETTTKDLFNKFSPKVILVNHEKELNVDTTCANLAIKYNMIYISAYQVIKYHIEQNTPWGQKLLSNKREKGIQSSFKVIDEFKEGLYSPVHYDLPKVMQLLKETVAEKRSN